MDGGIDPRELLNVPRNCTQEEVKQAFKRLSKHAHPDRGGDEHLFKMVTAAFKMLMKECAARDADRQHWQLTGDARDRAGPVPSEGGGPAPPLATMSRKEGGKFSEAFNAFFDKNRMGDPADGGYGDQMAPQGGPRGDVGPPPPLYSGGFSVDRFNRTFDEKVQVGPAGRQLSSVFAIQPAVVGSSSAVAIHGERPADFGGACGSLRYADYMAAHTTARLVDPAAAARVGAQSMKALQAERSAAPTLTEQEHREYALLQARERQAREREDRLVAERDLQIQQHHDRVNRMLLMNQR